MKGSIVKNCLLKIEKYNKELPALHNIGGCGVIHDIVILRYIGISNNPVEPDLLSSLIAITI